MNGEPPESVKLEVKDLRARLISLKRKAERCNNIIPPSPPSVTPPSPPKVTTPYIPPDEDPNIDTSIPREDYIHELRDAPRA